MSSTDDPFSAVRRRLLWRASRRGIKEMDILVGGFAERRVAHMSGADLQAFEAVLDIPDQQLLAFVTQQEQVPPPLDTPLLRELLAFRPDFLKA